MCLYEELNCTAYTRKADTCSPGCTNRVSQTCRSRNFRAAAPSFRRQKNSLKVRLSNRFVIFLLRKGLDLKSSAKDIRTELEELLLSPLSRLVGSGQLTCGDVLMIRTKEKNGEIQIERISGRQRKNVSGGESPST